MIEDNNNLGIYLHRVLNEKIFLVELVLTVQPILMVFYLL